MRISLLTAVDIGAVQVYSNATELSNNKASFMTVECISAPLDVLADQGYMPGAFMRIALCINDLDLPDIYVIRGIGAIPHIG